MHLGSRRAQAELLLDFLRHHRAEFLYLVGDIADDARAQPFPPWPDAHRAVLEALRTMARAGTRVHHVTGNHDPSFGELWGGEAELAIAGEFEHATADGRRLWVLHGERFDGVVQRRRWLGALGDALARALERTCEALEILTRAQVTRLGLVLRQRCKAWLGYTARFERSALSAVRSRSVDGVICGHAHAPASRTIDGLYYGNGGDWVGSATALVEHDDGRIELLAWRSAA